MGAYGLIRINMELLPHAHSLFSPWLMIIGTIQIIYAALTSPGQRISSITDTGLNGAILQIISHGFIGAALFFLAGTSYDRIRLVYLDEMGGIGIPMPKYSHSSVVFQWHLLHYQPKISFNSKNTNYFWNGNWNDINSYLFIIYVTSNVLWI
ncbi:NAD(P)H-quinone oxidoreductase chain 4 chloroplastic [Bienertia sinuspersici]